MQPSPILFLTSDAAERYERLEARDLDRRRLNADAEHDSAPGAATTAPSGASVRQRVRSLGHLLGGRRGAPRTGL